MSGKSFLIDTSACIACRSCQVACKSWNQNDGTITKNRGSRQNPQDLNGETYKLVRFREERNGGRVSRYFFSDQCRHCIDAPCKDAIDFSVKGGVIHDPATGAVVYTEKTRGVPIKSVREQCPYDIPRQKADGTIVKCTMCIDRVSNGLVPACVKACPTGGLHFGDREQVIAAAQKRLAALKPKYPKAQLLDVDLVRAIYLVLDDPKEYHKNAVASAAPGVTRNVALRRMFGPAVDAWRTILRG
ncbi:MAG: 4Fe-4S dicluster domain-containing protein [Proteobacteria bacterium]|nr:4Fe-4S dicluster domain-containing protein [Pseudomonadota bacterium]